MKTPSVSTIQLRTFLAVVLPALLCLAASPFATAQVLKHPIALQDRSQASATTAGQAASASHRFHLCGTGRIKDEHVDPDRDHLTTIPHWSGSFNYHGINYPYTMVGTDPSLGSATTVIPTFIIPLKIVLPDGSVFDSNKDVIDGQTAIQGIVNSPLFQAYPFVSGGTHVGNTQYGDAAQRANFWNYVTTRSPDYHVLLSQPVVLPEQTMNVPANEGGYYQDPVFGPIPYVDDDFFNPAIKALAAQLGINSRQLPIFVSGKVILAGSNATAYHGAWYVSSTSNSIAGAQTYIATSYSSITSYSGLYPDIYPLSHELNEWINDPFDNNFTPGWNIPSSSSAQCDSYISLDRMEVCDVIEDGPHPFAGVQLHGVAYHLTDRVFLDFFTRNPRSRSVNGQFSFFGDAIAPSSDCTGHLELSGVNEFSVPNALATYGHAINNRGQIVGDYIDSNDVRHGFSLASGHYLTIDPPGAISAEAWQVNDQGVIVGLYYTADGYEHGFSYQNGHYAALDFPGSSFTEALGINIFGEIVGDYYDNSGMDHGFTFSHGQYQNVDAPGANNTVLNSVNDLGLMTGATYADDSSPELGFLRLGAHYSPAQFPGSLDTVPLGLNTSGAFVGIFVNESGYADGFIKLFNYYYEVYATCIGLNDRGQMVGYTFDYANGVYVGFTAQVPIVPAGP